jgi:hypothetical protein
MDILTRFTAITVYFDKAFTYGIVRNVEVMLGQTLNHCVKFRNSECYIFVYCVLLNYVKK